MWHMRAAEIRALADDMNEPEPSTGQIEELISLQASTGPVRAYVILLRMDYRMPISPTAFLIAISANRPFSF